MADDTPTAEQQPIPAGKPAYRETPVPDHLEALIRSWERSLKAANKSPKTIRDYLFSARDFARYLAHNEMPTEVDEHTREHVETFIVAELERTTASSAASSYRRLQQWYRWLEDEGEIGRSPMAKMSPPTVEDVPPPVLSLDDAKALLKEVSGTDFISRRDTAIIRVFFDTGIRCAEAAGITVDDVDLDDAGIRVHGKGRKDRDVPIGPKTVVALDRYMRIRRRHRLAALPGLWLAPKGQLTDSGIRQMIERRARDAGIRLHPHMFRHTMAHRWQLSGGNEGDLMVLMGWSSGDMPRRYGRSAAAERARSSHARLALGDEL